MTDKLATETAIENELVDVADAFYSGTFDNPREFFNPVLAKLVEHVDDDELLNVLEHSHLRVREGSYWERTDPCVRINIDEIEIQFSGLPEDVFADVEDWTISGNLAYVPCLSLEIVYSPRRIEDEIRELQEEG